MADPAGPTDYRTEIVSIDPPTPAIAVEMIGGDSFMNLELVTPAEVIVIGYRGEPYLRFDPSGEVYENRRSPSAWLNQERYGSGQPPDYTDPEADPQWLLVGDSGRYAWHDHRSHWMSEIRPLGRSAGDVVLEATVPITVDGQPVIISVSSAWLVGPPVWPLIAGIALGAGVAAFALRHQRSPRLVSASIMAGVTLVFGLVAYRSVPSETQPSPLLWLLPLIALVAAVIAFAVRNRLATTVYLDGLSCAAGATLLYWGISRFEALRRALIPSDAPDTLDRLVIVSTLVVGAVLAAQSLVGLLRPKRLVAAS